MLSLTLLALTGCGASKNSEATPTAKATASASVTSDVFVSECGYGYSQKPSSITLTCADGGMYIDHITYSSWTSNSANGTGIFNENNCDPDCASGKFIKTKVSLMIDGPKKDSAGKLIFSNLNITATTKLYNGSKTASFDIWIEPETSDGSSSSQESSADQIDPQQATIDLIDRLNTESDLWQVNELATSDAGQMAHKRLGLYSEPDYVIECNLSYSGTWLFVYSDTNAAYDAFNSDYFFRTSSYSAKLMYDPQTNLIVILHTSMGGNRTCLNSAYKELEYYATDSN
jgi:hypothetical protein